MRGLMRLNLHVDAEKCCGCRTCEVMCTFHHKKVFGRKASSIQVKRLERKGEFEIIIHETEEDLHLACDLCEGEDEPLCVKFCPTEVITLVGT